MSYSAKCDECNAEIDPEIPERKIKVSRWQKSTIEVTLQMRSWDRPYHLCDKCLPKLLKLMVGKPG